MNAGKRPDMSEKLLTACADPGIFGRGWGGGGGVQARLPENSIFSPQLILQFYNGLFQTKL